MDAGGAGDSVRERAALDPAEAMTRLLDRDDDAAEALFGPAGCHRMGGLN